MHRPDNTRFLLYIEPKKEEKAETPVEDEMTRILRIALSEAKTGTANYYEADEPPVFCESESWRGYHRTDCGERSESCDYLLENGMITNSLCVFYIQYYRNSVPQSELNKVTELVTFYKNKYRDNPEMLFREIVDYSKLDAKGRFELWVKGKADEIKIVPPVILSVAFVIVAITK